MNKNFFLKKPVFWNRFLYTTIVLMGVVFIFFLAKLVNIFVPQQPSTPTVNQKKNMTQAPSYFFEHNTIYYLKTTDGDQVFKYIADSMKSLQMEKESAKTALAKLNLDKIKEGPEGFKQFFFYKIKNDSVCTYIISDKEKDSESRQIKVEMKIEIGGTNAHWGIYRFEGTLQKDAAEISNCSLKHIGGKYNTTRSEYKPLAIDLSGNSLDDVLKALASGIQKTIQKNPGDTQENGRNLKFVFTLLGDDYSYTKISEGFDYIMEDRIVNRVVKTNGIDQTNIFNTYKITDKGKALLVPKLKDNLTKLLGNNDNTGNKQRIIIEVYINSDRVEDFSELPDKNTKMIRTVLNDNIKNDTFQNWDKILRSKGISTKFVELNGYIKTRLETVKPIEGPAPKQSQEGLGRAIAMTLLSLFIVIGLFYFRDQLDKKLNREKGKRNKENRKPPSDPPAAPEQPIGDLSPLAPLDNESDEDAPDPGEESLSNHENEKKNELKKNETVSSNEQYKVVEEKRKKLNEIGTSIGYLLLEVIRSDSHAPDREAIEKLKAAQKIANAVYIDKTIKLESLNSKVGEILDNFKKFRDRINKPFLNSEFDKIENKLLNIKSIEASGKMENGMPPIVPGRYQLTEIKNGVFSTLSNLNSLKSAVIKIKEILRKGKRAENFEESIAKAIEAPIEIKALLDGLGPKVDKISKDLDSEVKLELAVGLIKKLKGWEITKINAESFIKKVDDEQKISQRYRECAARLHDDMVSLEERYNEKWFWRILSKNFLGKLKESIDFFTLRNKSARNIYERYLQNDIPLSKAEPMHIKKLVEKKDWPQIWDGVIRMSDFFNAYFEDELVDVQVALAYHSQQIKEILKELGYTIKKIKPLDIISIEERKKKGFEKIDKAYIEEAVLKKLIETENSKLLESIDRIPGSHEQVIYVERLGLINKLEEPAIEVTNLRFGAFGQGILQTHLDSWKRVSARKRQNEISG